jgi:hypothetical protein
LGLLFRDGWQSSFFKAALKPFHDYISLSHGFKPS